MVHSDVTAVVESNVIMQWSAQRSSRGTEPKQKAKVYGRGYQFCNIQQSITEWNRILKGLSIICEIEFRNFLMDSVIQFLLKIYARSKHCCFNPEAESLL